MRMIPKYLLSALVAFALAGCTPNTDAAYKNCYDYLSSTYRADNPDATAEEAVDYLIAFADRCSSDAKKDPAAFNELWDD